MRSTPRRWVGPSARRPMYGPAHARSWIPALLLGLAGIGAARYLDNLPDLVRQASAVLVAVSLAWGLAVRTGGRTVWAAVVTLVITVAAFVTGRADLLVGSAVGTAVLASTLAVMCTVPARRFRHAVREALVATLIAGAGAVSVLGFGEGARLQVDHTRFSYAVLALALAGALVLVFRLGAGWHGLGRRGYLVAFGATALVTIAVAYSEALAQWGSRDLVGSVDDVREWVRGLLGAVPHPIMALLGYPALIWGVFMRARRRQGWWVTAFGIAATAPMTTRLVADDPATGPVLLGVLYSLLLGTVIGYVVIRVDQILTGSRGRRARRDEEAVALRPEPGRLSALQ